MLHHRARLATLACSAVLTLAVPLGAARADTVAIADVAGPKDSGAAAFEKALVAAMKKAGHKVIDPSKLGKAKRAVEVARSMNADVLVTVRIEKERKGFSAHGEVTAPITGEVKAFADHSYKKSKDAAKGGKALAQKLLRSGAFGGDAVASGGGAADEGGEGDEGGKTPVAAAEPPPPPPPPVATVASAPTTAAPASTAAVPRDEEPAASAKTEVSRGGAKAPIFMLRLGGGTQAATSYSVKAGDGTSGLGYSLGPIVYLAAGGRVYFGSTGIFLDADVAFAPVKYSLESISPPVEPAQPSGRFLDAGGGLGYAIALGKKGDKRTGTSLSPVLGVRYESLAVDQQSPYQVVIGSTAIAPSGGLRFELGIGRSMELEAEVRGRLVVSFSEDAELKTGEPGGGFGLSAGAELRYWLIDELGLAFHAGYQLMSVSLKGQGGRVTLRDDPPLVDASVGISTLRAGLGVVLSI